MSGRSSEGLEKKKALIALSKSVVEKKSAVENALDGSEEKDALLREFDALRADYNAKKRLFESQCKQKS
jgi:hypothetical protein